MKDKLLNFFFPPRCPFCGKINTGIIPVCEKCASEIERCEGRTCIKCAMPLGEFSVDICRMCRKYKRNFELSFTPLVYSGNTQKAILRFKHYNRPSYADAFAYLIADNVLRKLPKGEFFDFITFVPTERKAFRLRGYNPAELIARKLSEYLKIPCRATLIRKGNGKKQARLNAADRIKNVKQCYFKGSEKLTGNVLLIDDVYTTGATVNYCAKLLKSMGCDRVWISAVAMGKDYYS